MPELGVNDTNFTRAKWLYTYKTRQRRAYTFHLMMEACALSRIMRACLTVLNLDGAAHIGLESFIKEHH